MVVSTELNRFGSLKLIRIDGKDHFGRPIALCICDCGNICRSPLASLKQGDIKICGKCRPSKDQEKKRVRKKTGDVLVGQTFSYLSVIELADTRKGIKYYYCLCKCGNSKIAQHYRLLNGQVKSCGCIRKQPKKSLQPRTDGTYIGVYRSGKKWISRIHHDGNKTVIGSFTTQDKAVLARNRYIRKHRLEEWHLIQNIN
ncbi:MAG: hypothetical protein WBF90_33810 [Rivularia sp. (in: cyanobacteria)]